MVPTNVTDEAGSCDQAFRTPSPSRFRPVNLQFRTPSRRWCRLRSTKSACRFRSRTDVIVKKPPNVAVHNVAGNGPSGSGAPCTRRSCRSRRTVQHSVWQMRTAVPGLLGRSVQSTSPAVPRASIPCTAARSQERSGAASATFNNPGRRTASRLLQAGLVAHRAGIRPSPPAHCSDPCATLPVS